MRFSLITDIIKRRRQCCHLATADATDLAVLLIFCVGVFIIGRIAAITGDSGVLLKSIG